MPSAPISSPPSAESPSCPPIGGPERVVLWALLLVLLALRAAGIRAIPFDSDESQHLHVAWCWTQGLVQYRDVFDNHAPLFHLLTAPFVWALGERADVLYFARALMFPLFLGTLYVVQRIGRILFGARIAAWGALVLGGDYLFFTTSLEFRADDLWVLAWVLAIWILLAGRWSARRGFGAGLVLGLATCVSLKTSLPLACVAASVWAARARDPELRRAWPARRVLGAVAAVAAGVLIAPALVVAGFASAGALPRLVACTLTHQMVAVQGGPSHWARWLLLPAVAVTYLLADRLARGAPDPVQGARRRWFLLQGGVHAAVLYTIWPLSTREDALPLLPVLALACAAAVVPLGERLGHRVRSPRAARWLAIGVPGSVVVLLLGNLMFQRPPWRDETGRDVAALADVLRVADPSDPVLDPKGLSIFRRRPIYEVLEKFTRTRIRLGLLADPVPAGCVATGTCVVFGEPRDFLTRSRAFIAAAYVPIGGMRIAGRILEGTSPAGRPIPFDILVPARYAVVAETGVASGALDGQPYAGPVRLSAGPHTFLPSASGGRTAVVWAQAIERGFSPFPPAALRGVSDGPRTGGPRRDAGGGGSPPGG